MKRAFASGERVSFFYSRLGTVLSVHGGGKKLHVKDDNGSTVWVKAADAKAVTA